MPASRPYGSTARFIKLDNDGAAGSQSTISHSRRGRGGQGWVDVEGSYTRSRIEHRRLQHVLHAGSQWTNCRAQVSQPLVIAGSNDVLEFVD